MSQVVKDFKDDFKDNLRMIVPSFKGDAKELVLLSNKKTNNGSILEDVYIGL